MNKNLLHELSYPVLMASIVTFLAGERELSDVYTTKPMTAVVQEYGEAKREFILPKSKIDTLLKNNEPTKNEISALENYVDEARTKRESAKGYLKMMSYGLLGMLLGGYLALLNKKEPNQ